MTSFIGNVLVSMFGVSGAQWAQEWEQTQIGQVVNGIEQTVGVPVATAAGILGLILIIK